MKNKHELLIRALILATLLVSGIAQVQDGEAQSPLDPTGTLATVANDLWPSDRRSVCQISAKRSRR
jgi:hypothetical protein